MKNNNRKILLTALSFIIYHLSFSSAGAQSEVQYRIADATQLWRLTDNAAGLSLDSSQTRAVAYFDFQHREGDYHRVQEGGQRNQLDFYTERYQRISSILVGYGSFRFDMDRTKDRAWCDVMRPYNSNPFISGSSVPGKYDTQQFQLTAAMGTIQLWRLTSGVRLDYKVGDLSRLRDPRSRSELLDYKLTPSLTYSFGNHTIGLSGHYNRRKEKIPSMTTVQQDPSLKYYLMSGMEQAVGTTGGYSGYSREWVDHRFGAELNYNFRNSRFNSLTSANIERGSEDVLGQYKYEPGHYMSYRYGLSTLNRFKAGHLLHQIDLAANYQEAYADEYRQQLIQERDAEKGYTSYHYETQITFRKRYQVKLFSADLHYRCTVLPSSRSSVDGGLPAGSYLGGRASLNNSENKHLLPASTMEYAHLDLTAEGGTSLLNSSLWLDVEAGYHISQKADLNLADRVSNVTTTIGVLTDQQQYAHDVLIPDQQYYDANYWRAHVQLTYQFPLSIKGNRNDWFVRLYGDYLSASHSLSSKTVGLSLGLYY